MINPFNFFQIKDFKTSDKTSIRYQLNFNPDKKMKKKTVLVFNYGLVCSNEHFRPQIDYFNQLGYPIILHDYRGHFDSSGKEKIESITLKNIAKDLNELLTFLNINNAHFVCHSMGVNVGVEFYKNYPEKIKSLILISGTLFSVYDVMFGSKIMNYVIPYLYDLSKEKPGLAKNTWNFINSSYGISLIIQRLGFNKDFTPVEFIQNYLENINALGHEIFFQLINQMKHQDKLATLEQITTPTLVIAGDKDLVIPLKFQKFIHQQIENSEFKTIEGGSHVPQIDFPDKVNYLIETFLQNV